MMEYTELKGVKISKFTLGTVQLGVNYGMANQTGKPSPEKAFEILDTARNCGVATLDTAAAYGTSEEVVGSYLQAKGHPMAVVSKFKLKTDDPITELKGQIANSKALLGTVDGYLFHDADQMRMHHEKVRPYLEEMKQTCGTSFVGASVYTAEDVEDFLNIPWLEAIQVPMSILDTRIVQRGLLDELKKRGVIVFVRSVFMQGMLCMDKAPEKFAFMQPSLDALREVANAEGISMPQMAVSYIRDLSGVHSLALGCETPQQVEANAKLICGPALSEQALASISEISKNVPIEHCMNVILGRA